MSNNFNFLAKEHPEEVLPPQAPKVVRNVQKVVRVDQFESKNNTIKPKNTGNKIIGGQGLHPSSNVFTKNDQNFEDDETSPRQKMQTLQRKLKNLDEEKGSVKKEIRHLRSHASKSSLSPNKSSYNPREGRGSNMYSSASQRSLFRSRHGDLEDDDMQPKLSKLPSDSDEEEHPDIFTDFLSHAAKHKPTFLIRKYEKEDVIDNEPYERNAATETGVPPSIPPRDYPSSDDLKFKGSVDSSNLQNQAVSRLFKLTL